MLNMNSKIEPDGEALNFDKINCFFNKNEIMEKPISDKEELKKFVENTIKKSNFSTRNMEAFYNVKNIYYPVKNNNNILSKQFLKGEIQSGLLKLNEDKSVEYDINISNNINNINNENINIENIENNSQINKNENEELKPDGEEIFQINEEEKNKM